MVGHQTTGRHLSARPSRGLTQQIAVQRVVVVLEERLLTAIATLRRMIGVAGHNQAARASLCRDDTVFMLLVNCHRNWKIGRPRAYTTGVS